MMDPGASGRSPSLSPLKERMVRLLKTGTREAGGATTDGGDGRLFAFPAFSPS